MPHGVGHDPFLGRLLARDLAGVQEIWQTASFPELQSFKSFLVGEFSESPELATLHDTLGDEDCGILAQACDVVLLNSGLEAGHA